MSRKSVDALAIHIPDSNGAIKRSANNISINVLQAKNRADMSRSECTLTDNRVHTPYFNVSIFRARNEGVVEKMEASDRSVMSSEGSHTVASLSIPDNDLFIFRARD